MVIPGSGLSRDHRPIFEEVGYLDHVNLRTDSYTNSPFERSEAIMSITGSGENRDHGDSNGPKKRISMACGRCRKRKIRCSGDSGDGQPCTNCANANHSPCQFLRVNSCETLYRDGFNYNMEVSRLLGSRQSPNLGITSFRESPPSRPEETAYRGTVSRPGYEPERLWVQQSEPVNHHFSEYHLSTETGYGPQYRLAATAPPRGHEEAYYPLPSSTTPFYGTNGQTTTLAFRPAGMLSVQPPPAAGPYPNLNGVSRETAQRGLDDRSSSQQQAAYTSPRRPLPSTGGGYYTTSTQPGYSRAVPTSQGSHASPIAIDANGFTRFEVASLYSPGGDIVEVKMEPDGTAPQSEAQQAPLNHAYQYADPAQYRNEGAGHVPAMLPVPQSLPSHGPIELVRPNQSSTKDGNDISLPSSGRGK